MPRYFFHVRDGRSYPDLDGSELADLDAVKDHAVRFAGRLLTERGLDFWTGEEWSMEVADARGLILFTLHFFASQAVAMGEGSAASRVPSRQDPDRGNTDPF